jgi:hypothetical protein
MFSLLIWLLLWVAFSVVAAVIAGAKNRSVVGYFLLSLLLSPLIGLVLAAAMPARKVEYIPGPGDLAKIGRAPCDACGEYIMLTAKVCRFCGRQASWSVSPDAATATGDVHRDNAEAAARRLGLGDTPPS